MMQRKAFLDHTMVELVYQYDEKSYHECLIRKVRFKNFVGPQTYYIYMWKPTLITLPCLRCTCRGIIYGYHSNSVANRRAHWSLKTRYGVLPSNIAREQKITSGLSYFLRRRCRYYRGIDVMAELGLFDESMYTRTKNKGLWNKKRELKKKKRQLKRLAEESKATGRRGPRRRE